MTPTDQNSQDGSRLEGRYANAFQVGHNAFEFLFDLGQVCPEREQAWFHTRIITSPAYARLLSTLLQDALEQYEATFGPIPAVE